MWGACLRFPRTCATRGADRSPYRRIGSVAGFPGNRSHDKGFLKLAVLAVSRETIHND
ncbi:hypothetical protein SPHINGOT1_260324 [Sphingomonas sp. T1]|nr:hypothetical protein SPHINGOT1_260324 [Sphingomonas sp. T1]